ncbi:MAG TPA: response regulator [Gemmatimonadaceae bacterium]|nr:response regulator [Gemmatimonadaceae bacterium]
MTAPAMNAAGIRVLIAEDHVDSATSIGRLLRLFGYEVAIATNGEDAVRVAGWFAPAAALIDLTLPVLDGFGVARALRENVATRDCRLVAMTGWTADEYAARTRDAGFDSHLVKPIAVEALINALSPAVPSTSANGPAPAPRSIAAQRARRTNHAEVR